MNFINIKTNKSDIILKINDTDAGIVLVTCGLDVECLCNTVNVDGTFKRISHVLFIRYTLFTDTRMVAVFHFGTYYCQGSYRQMWKLILDHT